MLNCPAKSKSLYMLVALVFLIVLTSSVAALSLALFLMQLPLAVITVWLLSKKDHRLAKLYLVIFLTSMLFVFLVYEANISRYGSPYYIGGSDDLNFENEGKIIADSGMYNPSEIVESGIIGRWHNAPFFSLFISVLMRLSEVFDGYSTFLPRIANVYFLLWVCMILEYLLRRYANFTDYKVYVTIALFALTPNIQYINSHVFRDTLNLLQIFATIALFDKVVDRNRSTKKLVYLGVLGLLLYMTYYTRKPSLLFSVVICILILFSKMRINKKYVLLLAVPILMFIGLLSAADINYYVDTYTRYVLSIAGDGLSRHVFLQPLLPFGIILRAFYALISPFPDFFSLFGEPDRFLYDLVMFLIYIGVVVQIIGIPFILKKALRMDWLSIAFLVWFLAVIATTFTFRHVILYYPFLVAVGVDGFLTSRKETRAYALLASSLAGCSLSIMYLALKHLF